MAEESRSRVIPEWNSPDLEYVEPTQVVRSFGYDIFSGPYDEEAVRHDQKTIECVLDVDGPVNETKTAYDSPEAAARDIKEKARALGATLVGITGLDPFHVYKGHDVPHANVVMIAVPMEYDEIRFGATPRHVRCPRPHGRDLCSDPAAAKEWLIQPAPGPASEPALALAWCTCS